MRKRTSTSTKTRSTTSARRVPQRTCVGCRTTSGKREFVRVVRTTDGRVEVDPTSKANGRGAYVCARASCWEQTLTKDRLGRALRTTVSPEDRDKLRRFAEGMEPVAMKVEG